MPVGKNMIQDVFVLLLKHFIKGMEVVSICSRLDAVFYFPIVSFVLMMAKIGLWVLKIGLWVLKIGLWVLKIIIFQHLKAIFQL